MPREQFEQYLQDLKDELLLLRRLSADSVRTINICERVEYMCTGIYREAGTFEFDMGGVN